MNGARFLPRRLPERATIGIFAPSGLVDDATALQRAVDYLQRRGHRVIVDEAVDRRWKYFAGEDHERLAAIRRMVAHPDIDLVIAARGGYGLSRLLPDIDFAAVAASGKLFLGFSDFTLFHLAALSAGAISFAGPMAAVDLGRESVDPFTEYHLWETLGGAQHRIGEIACAHGVSPCNLQGPIWGGNLSLVVHLLGSRHLPDIDDGILFLEDVAEQPYHIERMLLQLHAAGILARQRALILGQFTDCVPTTKSRAPYSMEDVIESLRERLRIPVLTGLPFGHVAEKITIPVGSTARLALSEAGYTVTFSDYNLPNI